MKIKRLFLVFGIVLMLLAACNLPGDGGPTPQVINPKLTTTSPLITPQITVVTPTFEKLSTATSLPATKTPVLPTATTEPEPRPGASVEAVYFASPPAIDADWNDYTSLEYAAEVVVYGLSNWTDRNDLAGSFRIGWDAANLYIGVKIRDDKYVQNASGEELFKGDSIEIILDADLTGDIASDKLSSDDFQLGISLGKPKANQSMEAYLWFPAGQAGAVTGVKAAAVRDDSQGITRAEFAIPWSLFGVMPQVGDSFGFALSVSDNDDTTKNAQQSMVSSAKGRNLADPTTWGELLLGK